MKNQGSKKPMSDAGKTAQKINKDQRAPHPGGPENAAGKKNKNKMQESAKLGSTPVKNKDLNRGK